jgi:hypothetical protein
VVRSGVPSVVFAVTGAQHSPRVRITPPRGATIEDSGAVTQGASGGVVILHGDGGTATDKTGKLRVLPDSKTTYVVVPKPAGARRVVAVVEQNGLPRVTKDVASFDAPGPIVPERPRLRVKVVRGALVTQWAPVAAAGSYRVDVTLGDGRHIVRQVSRHVHRVEVGHYRRAAGVVVSVAAVSAAGHSGESARRTIAAVVHTKPLKL